MHTLRAEIETETGEHIYIEGASIQELVSKAKTALGEFAAFMVRSIAVLSVMGAVCFKVGDYTYCFEEPRNTPDIATAGQTTADETPFYKGAE